MPNWKKIVTSGSDASLNSLIVSSGITGSLFGTSSYSVTASYALNGGVTQIIAGTNVTISPTDGLGVVTINADFTGFNATASFNNLSVWNFNHALNNRNVIVQAYDSAYNQIIPQTINLVDDNNATITFPTNESGFAIASLGGTTATATSASYALYAVTASYALNGGGVVDTGSLLTTASVSLNTITFTKGDGSTFPITIDTGSASAPVSSTFPYTGSAIISGSLLITGSLNVSDTITAGPITGSKFYIKSPDFSSTNRLIDVKNSLNNSVIAADANGAVTIGNRGNINTEIRVGAIANVNEYYALAEHRFICVDNSFSTAQAMVIAGNTSQYKVGIRTASPVFTLDVSGSGRFTNGLIITGSVSASVASIGSNDAPAFLTSTKTTVSGPGTFVVYSLPTASYDGAFYDYTVRSGVNARAGSIMAIWSGSSVNYTETTTTDFGSTTGLTFGVFVSGSNMVLSGSAPAGTWSIKTIIRSI